MTTTTVTWAEQMAAILAELAPEVERQEPEDEPTVTLTLRVPASHLERALANARREHSSPKRKPARKPEPDARPIERRIAGWWAAHEAAETGRATIEMQRRIARALQRGGAHRLGVEETWRRVQVWSAARHRNGRRPSAKVLQHMIRDDAEAERWSRAVSGHDCNSA